MTEEQADSTEKLLEAQNRIMELRRRGVAFGYSVLGDFHDAEDAYQEASLVVIRRIGDYKGNGFDPWFWTILRNVIGTHLRSKARNRLLADSDLLERLGGFYFESGHGDEDVDRLMDCVRRLPGHTRRILERHFMEGLGCGAIARELGRSVQSVYALIKRGKDVLRECMRNSASPIRSERNGAA